MNKFIDQCFMFLLLTASLSGCLQNSGNNQTESSMSSLMLTGDWLPDDPHRIDFQNLPKLPYSEYVIVHDVRQFDGNRVNQHNYLTYFDGAYWCMWSDGPGVARAAPGKHRDKVPGHDQSGQKISYAVSTDGLNWSEAENITDIPNDGYGWIARGFWIRDGRLLALATRYKAPGYAGDGLALHAFEWSESNQEWFHLGLTYDNAMNNFPPQQLPSGEWMMSRRDSLKNVHLLFGGTQGFDKWKSIPMVEYEREDFKAEEPTWWTLPNGRLSALFRDNAKSGYLFRSFSDDFGKTWSEPTKTNFPDATSKFSSLRLEDGRYVLVSNPNPMKRDPMTLAISSDGIVFDKLIYLVGGRHVDYPHVMEHGGYLLVAFASAKQSVEVIRVKLTDIDSVEMPTEPLSNE